MSVQIQEIEIPNNVIEPQDAADFEAMRLDVYRQTKPKETTREQRLTELADLVTLKPGVVEGAGSLSIHEAILRALEAHLNLGKVKKTGYRFSLDDQGNIVGIDKVSHLPQDKRATEAARRASARVPWARKQNETSFRIPRSRLPAERLHI